VDIKSIKSLIQDVLWEIPEFYRCYEITRRLKTEFAKRGIAFEVKDGFAFYNALTFFTEAKKKNCELLLYGSDVQKFFQSAKLAAEIGKREKIFPKMLLWRISIFHSWGILSSKRLLIDYHKRIVTRENEHSLLYKNFPILKKIEVRNFLNVIPMKKLPTGNNYLYGDTVFWETAREVNGEICYPKHDYSTKLRHMSPEKYEKGFLSELG
jgi:hypothetical protein